VIARARIKRSRQERSGDEGLPRKAA